MFQIVVYCVDQGVIEDTTIDAAEIGLGRWPIQQPSEFIYEEGGSSASFVPSGSRRVLNDVEAKAVIKLGKTASIYPCQPWDC